jgi:hypothetical protein
VVRTVATVEIAAVPDVIINGRKARCRSGASHASTRVPGHAVDHALHDA